MIVTSGARHEAYLLNQADGTGAEADIPTVITDGILVSTLDYPKEAMLHLWYQDGLGTAGDMRILIKIWGFTLFQQSSLVQDGIWAPLGIVNPTADEPEGDTNLKGVMNNGQYIRDVRDNQLAHLEQVCGIQDIDALYAQVIDFEGNTGGTVTLRITNLAKNT